MKRPLLLGVTALCLCAFVAADTPSDRQGDKSFPEKDGVLQLNKGNFNRALRKYKQLLVHFCKLHIKADIDLHVSHRTRNLTTRGAIFRLPHTAPSYLS